MHGSVSYISCSNFNSLEAPFDCSVPQSQRLLIHPTPTAPTQHYPTFPATSQETVARAVCGESTTLSIQTLTIYRSYGRIRGACRSLLRLCSLQIPILFVQKSLYEIVVVEISALGYF